MILPTTEVLEYIEQLYTNEELNKKDFTTRTVPNELGEVVDDDVARFLKVLLTLKQPSTILEVGTSVGYSTVSMAQVAAQYGATITTIELDEEIAAKAAENFVRYGVSDIIHQLVGDAAEILPALTQRFDYIFMDVGEKSLYEALTNCCVEKLNPGGMLVAEDSLYGAFASSAKDDEMAQTLNDFNVKVSRHPELESTLLPIGDGVTVAVKKG